MPGFHYIDTMEELAAKRQRLEQEAELARSAFIGQVRRTYQEGVNFVAEEVSVPKVLSAAAALGIRQLAGEAWDSREHQSMLDQVQQGIAAYERKEQHKWTAFIPLGITFLQEWLEGREEAAQHELPPHAYPPQIHG